jgi:Na+/H+ antiporter NhaD/arsenite permease-like protein
MKELLVLIVSFIALILSIIVMVTSSKLKNSSDTLIVNRANTIYNAGTGLFVISLFIVIVSGFKTFQKRKEYGLGTSHYM